MRDLLVLALRSVSAPVRRVEVFFRSASVVAGAGLLLRLRGFSEVGVLSLSGFRRQLSLSPLAGVESLRLGSVGGGGVGVGLLLLFLSAILLSAEPIPFSSYMTAPGFQPTLVVIKASGSWGPVGLV